MTQRHVLTATLAQLAMPILFFASFSIPSAQAELLADQILVLANRSLDASMRLAEEYIRARSLDPKRFVALPLPTSEYLSREEYEQLLIIPLRNELSQRRIAKDIRLIISVWGVPLTVAAPPPESFAARVVERLSDPRFRTLPAEIPPLETIISWKQVLGRSTDWKDISLSAQLSYMAGRQAGLRVYTEALKARLHYDEALASIDSELMLLWYDRSQYSLASRIGSPFFHGHGIPPGPIPVLLTGRLDGPSPEIARHLFEMAIETEKSGLAGKIYVDARGLSKLQGGLGAFDEELRKFAAGFGQQTKLPVVFDNEERRFNELKPAPGTALYAGWYSLRSYENAFEFRPGAIGYHIASEECVSLRKTDERGWCKNALQHGITATLGPVEEPFVDAFPAPLEFFGLIATGRYSLVEAYALSSRTASWRMTLLGDPLYRPFKNAPLFSAEALAALPEWPADMRPLPASPSSLPFADPEQARREEPEALRQTEKEVELLFRAQNGA